MKKNILVLLLFSAVAAIFFDGCVPAKPTEEVEILPSERLINKLEVNRRRIGTFEGTGTIAIKSSQFNNSATFRIIVSKPDSIFLTIMGPFGIDLAQAVVTTNDFAFYDALQNTVYKGNASDEVLREIFKIDLSFKDLLDAFVGSVNLTDKLYTQPQNYEVIYDNYILTYVDAATNVSTKYTVDVRQLGIVNYLLSDNTGVILEGNYSKFSLLQGIDIPYHIEVKNVRENQLITIDYKNMRANQKDIYINFSIPDDATVISW